MATARVFKSGNSQAVRLPKEFRFQAEEVEIYRRGKEVVLRERRASLADLLEGMKAWPNDFEIPPDMPSRDRDFSGFD